MALDYSELEKQAAELYVKDFLESIKRKNPLLSLLPPPPTLTGLDKFIIVRRIKGFFRGLKYRFCQAYKIMRHGELDY